MASKPPTVPLKGASDLATMWETAVVSFEKRTGKSLQVAPFRSMEEVVDGTDTELQRFGGFRKDKTKVEKVRSAFGKNLSTIKKVLGGIKMLADAASVFPPAMPATLVFSAFGYVLQSFSNVSADYDKVESFFNKTHRFLDRLSILEDKSPAQLPFQRCVVRVFSSQLELLAIAQGYEEKERMKKWLLALWEGTDKELDGAFKVMDNAIEELSQALGFATYREAREAKEEAREAKEEAQRLGVQVRGVQVTVNTMNTNLKGFHQDFSAGISAIRQDYSAGVRNIRYDLSAGVRTMQNEMSEMMSIFLQRANKKDQEGEKPKKSSQQRNSKMDVGDRKYAALDCVRMYFSQSPVSASWDSARMQNKAQRQEIYTNFVPGTGAWLVKEDKHFGDWKKGETPILWLNGSDGVGKSFLAYAAAKELSETFKDHERNSVAYFYFRETNAQLRSAKYALACTAWQIADSNSKYCEQVTVDLKRETFIDEGIWKLFFADRYSARSGGRLFMILDGLDEMEEDEREDLLKSLAEIIEGPLKISVLLTSRPDLRPVLEPLNPVVIEITKENLSSDITWLIKARCKSLPRLHKFPRRVRTHIIKKVKSKADGMLYVEHMLRRLSYIGHEDAVLKDLEQNLPDDLQSLYQLMLTECHKGRTKAQYTALKRLFAWLAFSKRPLTLSEATALVKVTVPDGSFNFEDEIIGRSASWLKLLDLERTYDDDDEAEEDEKSIGGDESHEEADLNVPDHGNTVITFVERSLRDFFRALDINEEGLRTPLSAAHLTIFGMAASIITNAKLNEVGKDESSLADYAAVFWQDHLVEIDLSKAMDHDVTQVLNSLYLITNNTNNVANALERYSFCSMAYPPQAFENEESWLSYLNKWIERGTSLAKGVLTPEVEAWVHRVAASPLEVLLPLAQGHVMNWYKAEKPEQIANAFGFAKAALDISKEPHPFQPTPSMPEEVDRVTSAFPDIIDIEKDAGAKRAIGTVLFYMDRFDQGILYLNQSLTILPPGSSSERFHTYYILQLASSTLQFREEAIKAIDQAIAVLPPSWRENAELVKDKKDILLRKAELLVGLGQGEAAIEAYKEAAAVEPINTIGGWNLDEMTRVRGWDADPTGAKLIELLKGWTEKERLDWFDYLIRDQDIDSLNRFSQAAQQNGESGIKFLLNCYADYEKTLLHSSRKKIFFQAQLADIYRGVIGDKAKAKALYKTIRQTTIRTDDPDDGLDIEPKLSEVRLSLADMIFTEFRQTADPVEKATLLEEMKKLEGRDYDIYESHVGVMLAIMSRVLGPATEFQSHMEKTFNMCIEGLTDTAGWNDSQSFRLLAKALACMEGLEREALIAISCQFSVVNLGIYRNEEPEDDDSAEENDSGEAKGDGEDGHDEDAQDKEKSGNTPATTSSTTMDIDMTEHYTNGITEKTTITAEVKEIELSEVHTIDLDIKEQKDTIAAITTAQTNIEAGALSEEDVGHVPKDTIADDRSADKPELDEDLNDMGRISCDGPCGNFYSSYTDSIYFCVTCANTDLCPSCHSKRLSMDQGEKSDYWRRYCGKDHRYIKGPIQGWKGVKDGVIRFGGEEIEFKEWLKDLEEVKWKKAWETFWRWEGGLKDIEG